MTSRSAISIVIPAFNAESHIRQTLEAVLPQARPHSVDTQILVVDDGSTDRTAEIVWAFRTQHVELLKRPENRGRAAARNFGAFHAAGDVLIFLDADCMPQPGWLTRLLAPLLDDVVCVVGAATSEGLDFWSAYQRRLAERRIEQSGLGQMSAYTSSNFAIRREVFNWIGKFNESFRHYGFEDLEFFARLIQAQPKVFYEPGASVLHIDAISLATVFEKMTVAGRFSAPLMRQLNSSVYSKTVYAKLDASLCPVLACADQVTYPTARAFIKIVEQALHHAWIPMVVKSAIVKLFSGVAYIHGTRFSGDT